MRSVRTRSHSRTYVRGGSARLARRQRLAVFESWRVRILACSHLLVQAAPSYGDLAAAFDRARQLNHQKFSW
jgi:uncharacterized membrane-anchored protein